MHTDTSIKHCLFVLLIVETVSGKVIIPLNLG